jgi:integrase
MTRHQNHGIRKLCDCRRANWPKCKHAWYLNFKPRGGPAYRFSLDVEAGKHLETKEDAVAEADRIRNEIRDGSFVRAADRRKVEAATKAEAEAAAVAASITIEQLGETYFKKYRIKKATPPRPLSKNDRYRWDLIMRTMIERPNGATVRFGDLDVRSITRHDLDGLRDAQLVVRVEKFKDSRGRNQTWLRGGHVSANRSLRRLRGFFNWAVEEEHVEATPFKKKGSDKSAVEMYSEQARERRLAPDILDESGRLKEAGEERRLLAAAGPHLQALIVAAVESGCRKGELLTLQWHQVRFDLNEIHLPAKKTKARRPRHLPISTRLKALLEMRRTDPAGKDSGPDKFVFGDVAGEQIKNIDTAWDNAVLKAHGVKVERDGRSGLTPACREALRRINLDFHDLRREAASRLLEGGMPLSYVQLFIDHANISTTSRYLQGTAQGMHDALKKVEETRSRCNSVAIESSEAKEADQGVAANSLH